MKRMENYKYHAAIKMRGYPSQQQTEMIKANGGASRFVYNRLVAINDELYRLRKVGTYIRVIRNRIQMLEEARDAKHIMNAAPFLYDMDSGMVANAIRNYNRAWDNHNKGRASIPTFHKKTNSYTYQTNPHYNSQSKTMFDCTGVKFVDKKHIILPKIGRVRIKASKKLIDTLFARMAETRMGTTTITLDETGKLYISIQLASDTPFAEQYIKTGNPGSFDLNLRNFLTMNDGTVIDNPRWLKKTEERLKALQKILSRKERQAKKEGRDLRNCKEYQKVRRKIAKLHKRIANQRLDFHHELAAMILKNHDTVYAEDLKVKNMIRNHNLAKAISDVSWGQFLEIMTTKATMHGRTFVKIPPQYTTQTCSACGHVLDQEERLTLQDEEWTCPQCGTHHIRDHNAAKIILQRGLALSA